MIRFNNPLDINNSIIPQDENCLFALIDAQNDISGEGSEFMADVDIKKTFTIICENEQERKNSAERNERRKYQEFRNPLFLEPTIS